MAKRFDYSVIVRSGGPTEAEPDWTPEHLLLAGLGRCTLKSLAFHAERASVQVEGTASVDGFVTKRQNDGRYALVDVDCGLDVTLDPLPKGESLGDLLGLAERDCFVGASLAVTPRYEWRVNGEVVR